MGVRKITPSMRMHLPHHDQVHPHCTPSPTHPQHPTTRSSFFYRVSHFFSLETILKKFWRLAIFQWICVTIVYMTYPWITPSHALPLSSAAISNTVANAAVSVSGTGTEAPQPLLIPLKRLIPRRNSSSSSSLSSSSSSSLFSFSSSFKKRSPSDDASPIIVTPVDRVGYAGHILIGTPPQRLSVLFDTGSDLALVVSDQCQGQECPWLTHFSCSKSTSCTILGGSAIGANAKSTIVIATELTMAQEDEDSHPIVKSSALGEALSLEEGQRNEPGVRIKEKQFVNRDIQEQQQGGLNSTRVQQFDGYDLTKNEGPSTFIQDRLRSSKTLPPSLEQQYQIPDINSMKSENRPTSMVAEHLIGPGVIKLEDGLVPILGENSQSNELSVEGIHSDIISIEAPSPPPSPPPLPQILPSDFYNQTYVDGTWGAGIFVQDRIQIDNTLPNEANDLNYHKNGDGSSSKSTSHSVMATFLDVIQDNLELVQGYDGRISGLLGLTRGSPTGRKTFLQELVDQGSLHEPVVSMYLSTDGGSFLLGGIDPTQFLGELVYSPVTDPIAWQISLRGLGIRYRNNENGSNSLVPNSNSLPSLPPIINSSRTFDSYRQHYQQRRRLRRHLPSTDSIMHLSTLPLTPKTFPTTAKATYPSGRDETFKILPQLNIFQDAPLILDSGTSSILIPSDASQVIHSELHGNWDPIHQTWFLPCQGPDLIWWVSATHGIIQPYESLIYLLEDGRCQSLIFENPNADFWILGDTWLRGLYVVYDMGGNGRIGIATAYSGQDSPRQGKGGREGETRILTVKDSNAAKRLLPTSAEVESGWMLVIVVMVVVWINGLS